MGGSLSYLAPIGQRTILKKNEDPSCKTLMKSKNKGYYCIDIYDDSVVSLKQLLHRRLNITKRNKNGYL